MTGRRHGRGRAGDESGTPSAAPMVGETEARVTLRSDNTLPIDPAMLTPGLVTSLYARTETAVTGCMIWFGSVNTEGYATKRIGGTLYLVSRLVWVARHGRDIPFGHVIDHVAERGCRSKRCVSPDHLEAVSQRANVARGTCADVERKGQARLSFRSGSAS